MMHTFILALIILCAYVYAATACQACLFPIPYHNGNNHRPHHHQHAIVRNKPDIMSKLLPFGVLAIRHITRHHAQSRSSGDDEVENSKNGDISEDTKQDDSKIEVPSLSGTAIGALRFYKGFISPLLPPACRFLPTCSEYGVQAIEEFGTSKGVILIAWRLLRCSPFGGKGYDPPKWPPVPYTFSSY